MERDVSEPPRMRLCKAIVVGAAMTVFVSAVLGLSVVLLAIHEGSGD